MKMKRQNHINSIYSSTHKNFNDEYLTFSKFKFLFVLSFTYNKLFVGYPGKPMKMLLNINKIRAT